MTSDTVTPDTLLVGTTAHDASGSVITGTFDISSEYATYLTKTMTFSSVTSSSLIWSSSDVPLSLNDDYEYFSIMGRLVSTSHTTKQIVFMQGFHPGHPYTSSESRYGMLVYHGSSASSCAMYEATKPLTQPTAGYFYIDSDGIYFYASPTYTLNGEYLFTLVAKTKNEEG